MGPTVALDGVDGDTVARFNDAGVIQYTITVPVKKDHVPRLWNTNTPVLPLSTGTEP